VLRAVEIPVPRPAGDVCDNPGVNGKCIHPLRCDFGPIAAIAPVLRQSRKAEVIRLPLSGACPSARAF
jgi:hypothetical protein